MHTYKRLDAGVILKLYNYVSYKSDIFIIRKIILQNFYPILLHCNPCRIEELSPI